MAMEARNGCGVDGFTWSGDMEGGSFLGAGGWGCVLASLVPARPLAAGGVVWRASATTNTASVSTHTHVFGWWQVLRQAESHGGQVHCRLAQGEIGVHQITRCFWEGVLSCFLFGLV